jgi:hypothetical protein
MNVGVMNVSGTVFRVAARKLFWVWPGSVTSVALLCGTAYLLAVPAVRPKCTAAGQPWHLGDATRALRRENVSRGGKEGGKRCVEPLLTGVGLVPALPPCGAPWNRADSPTATGFPRFPAVPKCRVTSHERGSGASALPPRGPQAGRATWAVEVRPVSSWGQLAARGAFEAQVWDNAGNASSRSGNLGDDGRVRVPRLVPATAWPAPPFPLRGTPER